MLAFLSEFRWSPDTLFVLGMFAVPVTAIVCGAWYKIAKTTSDNELKRSMVERGMSADEIERIMAARTSDKQ